MTSHGLYIQLSSSVKQEPIKVNHPPTLPINLLFTSRKYSHREEICIAETIELNGSAVALKKDINKFMPRRKKKTINGNF